MNIDWGMCNSAQWVSWAPWQFSRRGNIWCDPWKILYTLDPILCSYFRQGPRPLISVSRTPAHLAIILALLKCHILCPFSLSLPTVGLFCFQFPSLAFQALQQLVRFISYSSWLDKAVPHRYWTYFYCLPFAYVVCHILSYSHHITI